MYNQDYGVLISPNSNITANSIPDYNFGRNDFSVTVNFSANSTGTLVGKKVSDGIPGWIIVLQEGGTIKFATDDGFGYHEAVSGTTSAGDGAWHNIAAIRRGNNLEIWLDAIKLNVGNYSNVTNRIPLSVSADSRLTVGFTDQIQEKFNKFNGCINGITLWAEAIERDEIMLATHKHLTEDEYGLTGFWTFANTLADYSEHANDFMADSVEYCPLFHYHRADGENNYFYRRIKQGERNTGYPIIKENFTVYIEEGTPFIYGICTSPGDNVEFPSGVILDITDPLGKKINKTLNTENTYVECVGSSPFIFIIENPQSGDWKFSIEASMYEDFEFIVQSAPTQDPLPTQRDALIVIEDDDGGMPYTSLKRIVEYFDIKEENSRANEAALVVGGLIVLVIGVAWWLFSDDDSYVFDYCDDSLDSGDSGYCVDSDKVVKNKNKQTADLYKCLMKELKFNLDKDTRIPWGRQVKRRFIKNNIDPKNYKFAVDVGGEGRFISPDGIRAGFPYAINMNTQKFNSQLRNDKIPYLLYVQDWGEWDAKWRKTNDPQKRGFTYNKLYPFDNDTVDIFYMESCPFREYHAYEMARCIRKIKGNKIVLYLFLLESDDYSKENRTNVTLLGDLLKNRKKEYNKYEGVWWRGFRRVTFELK